MVLNVLAKRGWLSAGQKLKPSASCWNDKNENITCFNLGLNFISASSKYLVFFNAGTLKMVFKVW